MATRTQVRELGHTYETAGRELQILPGQAFMIATGLPADGGDAPSPQELDEKPVLPGSSQHLVNPPPLNPTRKALTRFGLFEAGMASARDPKYTVAPQRELLRSDGAR
jgi:hypothetical protein